MATIHRDGDLSLLDGTVAVVGYGSQGHAHALNLHDSGVDVVVGLRPDSGSRAAAEEAGLEVAAVAEAVRGAQVVALLVPDHVQKGVWDAEVAPNLASGAAVLFAHGLNVHFGRIAPPPDPDAPGMFAFSRPGRIEELVGAAGFTDVVVDAVAMEQTFDDVDDYLATTQDCSRPFADALEQMDEATRDAVKQGIRDAMAPFTADDGSVRIPGQSLVATARA